jgi:hypothetical protein
MTERQRIEDDFGKFAGKKLSDDLIQELLAELAATSTGVDEASDMPETLIPDAVKERQSDRELPEAIRRRLQQ